MTLLWIPLTIAAAFLQNVRSALQKHLKGELGTIGATFVRFGYGFPFALLYLAALVLLFFACRRYGAFKSSTPPESLWRFL